MNERTKGTWWAWYSNPSRCARHFNSTSLSYLEQMAGRNAQFLDSMLRLSASGRRRKGAAMQNTDNSCRNMKCDDRLRSDKSSGLFGASQQIPAVTDNRTGEFLSLLVQELYYCWERPKWGGSNRNFLAHDTVERRLRHFDKGVRKQISSRRGTDWWYSKHMPSKADPSTTTTISCDTSMTERVK